MNPEQEPANGRVVIGELGGTHGVRGELRLFSLSDVPNRFDCLEEVWWIGKNQPCKRLKVAALRPGERFFLVRFEGYADPETASALVGGRIAVDKAERGRLLPGEFFVDDLIGLDVQDECGRPLGRVADVYQTGANDIYVVRAGEGRELLLPALKSVVLAVDLDRRRMTVRIPEGL